MAPRRAASEAPLRASSLKVCVASRERPDDAHRDDEAREQSHCELDHRKPGLGAPSEARRSRNGETWARAHGAAFSAIAVVTMTA
jgi:hypothetical protein